MTEEKRKPTPEEKANAAAEARAKAEALRKLKEQEAEAAEASTAKAEQPAESTAKPASAMTDEEKAKAKAAAAAAAAAKAKAAREASQAGGDATGGEDADAKAKAAAAAKAKAAAAAAAAAKAKAAREATQAGGDAAGGEDADAKAKAAAAAKAKAAAAAKAKAAGGGEPAEETETPKAPSKNQPYLDRYVKRLTEAFGADVLEAAYINELAKDTPTLVVKNEKWHEVARFLKEDEQLAFDYLSNLHGVDYEDRMEVCYFLYSYQNRQSVAVKVKTDREQPAVPSVMDIWRGADWNERETFDLFGIHFPGHTNLRRILLPDEWVGYPMRKDYVQYDEEV